MPQDITFTTATPFRFTVTGELDSSGEVVCDLRPSAIAQEGGALLAANNLDDLDDADVALGNLGATAVGEGVFKAATADAAQQALGGSLTGRVLFTAVDGAAAMSSMGMSDVGQAVATAVDEAAARSALNVSSVYPLVAYLPDIISANAVVVSVVAPFDCAVVGADLWASATIAAGDLTATLAINGVAVTDGVMTLATGATSGTLGACTPTGANEAVGRQGVISVTVGGGNTAAGRGTVTILVTPALVA